MRPVHILVSPKGIAWQVRDSQPLSSPAQACSECTERLTYMTYMKVLLTHRIFFVPHISPIRRLFDWMYPYGSRPQLDDNATKGQSLNSGMTIKAARDSRDLVFPRPFSSALGTLG